MKKVLRGALYTVIALLVLMVGSVWVLGLMRHADAAPEALTALKPGDDVMVEEGRYIVLRPRRNAEKMGVIFYPGAYADARGYATTLRPVALAGYRVVIVPMPLEFAMFGLNRALAVQAAFADIHRWVLIGHSLGGAMAATFASIHPDALAGLVLWDSYPTSAASLANYPRPVWHVHRATPDGKPPAAFAERRNLFPANSQWLPIPGGIHMYFGSFDGGGYREDWAPSISRDAEHQLVIAATLRALDGIAAGAP
jgi:pimeloyl-ACP methyl ester carboxylesterase